MATRSRSCTRTTRPRLSGIEASGTTTSGCSCTSGSVLIGVVLVVVGLAGGHSTRRSPHAQLAAGELRPGDQTLELLGGEPAGDREEAAVGNRGELVDGDVFRAEREALGHVLRRFQIKRLHVDHPARDLAVDADVFPVLDLGHLAAGVLEDELIAPALEQLREQPAIGALAAGAREQVTE